MPLPLAHDDSEKIYKEPELQNLLCILKKEADPDCIFPKLLAMLPFTERPEGQSRYSLPIENNIPGVVRYICIDFDRASDMDLNKFERVVDDATQSGWEIYKDNLVTHVKNHRWEAESSERLIDFDTESLERSMSLETESQARSMSSETESFENSEPFKRSMSSETGSSVNNTPSPSPTAVVPRLRRRRRRSSRI